MLCSLFSWNNAVFCNFGIYATHSYWSTCQVQRYPAVSFDYPSCMCFLFIKNIGLRKKCVAWAVQASFFFSDHLALPGDAVILVGDFNANSASLTIQAPEICRSQLAIHWRIPYFWTLKDQWTEWAVMITWMLGKCHHFPRDTWKSRSHSELSHARPYGLEWSCCKVEHLLEELHLGTCIVNVNSESSLRQTGRGSSFAVWRWDISRLFLCLAITTMIARGSIRIVLGLLIPGASRVDFFTPVISCHGVKIPACSGQNHLTVGW